MSDLTELWELPDDMSPADRLSVESILRHAGGKKIVMRRFEAPHPVPVAGVYYLEVPE